MVTKVKIPFGNGGTIELEGSFDEVKTEVEKVDELFEKLNTAIGQTATVQQEQPVTVTPMIAQQVGIPTVPSDLKKSPQSTIIYLLKNWGQQGKRLSEIIEALETNMVYKSRDQISATLSQAVRHNKVQRRKESGEWVFYPHN